MNAEGRKKIAELVKELGEITSNAGDIASQIETLKDEEREKFGNLSEGLQAGEKGQLIDAAAEALETAFDAAAQAETSAQEAIDALDNIE